MPFTNAEVEIKRAFAMLASAPTIFRAEVDREFGKRGWPTVGLGLLTGEVEFLIAPAATAVSSAVMSGGSFGRNQLFGGLLASFIFLGTSFKCFLEAF